MHPQAICTVLLRLIQRSSNSLIVHQNLYDQGARYFWIHNTGPLGCLPQNIAKFGTDASKLDELGCVSSHNQAAKIFNLQLHALCTKLQGQYPDSNVTYVDIFSIKSNLISNFSRYGQHLRVIFIYFPRFSSTIPRVLSSILDFKMCS